MNKMSENQRTLSATKAFYRSSKYTFSNLFTTWKWIFQTSSELWKQRQRIKRGEITPPVNMPPERQFQVLMKAFNKKPSDLPALRAQSTFGFWSAIFAALLLCIALIYGHSGISAFGMSFGGFSLDFIGIVRVLTPSLLILMAIRQAQSNWIFRNKRHGNLMDFIKSGDWLPRK